MLEFGNKEFRNLQEQVGKNQEDIRRLTSGITISYTVATLGLLLRLVDEENLGKYVIVSTPTPRLYVIAKNEDGEIKAVDLGKYPAVVEGPAGATGASGMDGKDGTSIYGTSAVLPSASSSDYKVGDLYLLQNGKLYRKIKQTDDTLVWQLQTSLKGEQGPKGSPGSNNIVANPSDSATVDLNKIKVNGITYSIPTAEDTYSRSQANSRFILRKDLEEPETLNEQDVENVNASTAIIAGMQIQKTISPATGELDTINMSFGGTRDRTTKNLHIGSSSSGTKLSLNDSTGRIDSVGEIAKKSDLAAIKMNAYQVVDATTYPTLQNFLDNFNGEEGYTYLYPDLGNDDYYRYIWENNDWIYLGNTSLSLEQYANLANENTFEQSQFFAQDVHIDGDLYCANVPALDMANTWTGIQTFTDGVYLGNGNYISTVEGGGLNIYRNNAVAQGFGASDVRYFNKHILPSANNTDYSLGNSTSRWKDLYLGNSLKLGTSENNYIDGSDNWITIRPSSGAVRIVGDIRPNNDNAYSIGYSGYRWKTLYLGTSLKIGNTEINEAQLQALLALIS